MPLRHPLQTECMFQRWQFMIHEKTSSNNGIETSYNTPYTRKNNNQLQKLNKLSKYTSLLMQE